MQLKVDESFLKDKKIGIFGLARTGISVFNKLSQIGCKTDNLFCYDDNQNARDNFPSKEVIKKPRFWDNCDFVIVSPGVHREHYIFEIKCNAFVCDIELLYLLDQHKNYISVTGTNGKTTTATLIHHVLNFCKINYGVGGNIGKPALDLLNYDYLGYVLELSSFQLDLVKSFKSNISILLNLSVDHIDRHKNMQNYINAKLRIFEKSDYCIIGVDDDYSNEVYQNYFEDKSNVIPISGYKILDNGVAVLNDKIYVNLDERYTFDINKNPKFFGDHNNQNIAACYAALYCLKKQ